MISIDLAVLIATLCTLAGLSLGLLCAGVHAQVLFKLLPPAVAARIRVIEFSKGEE